MVNVPMYEKVSWTIEADVLAQVRSRVPRGQQSSYATNALRRQLERDNLAETIDELMRENGPVHEDEVERYIEEWR